MVAKISLIIPVYNKAKFLFRCFDSITPQLRKEIEVIVVDDGSEDGGATVCDVYGEKYGFKIYHQKNKGVSEARNLGIDKSSGEYVAFLDADDFLAKDAFNDMLRSIKTGLNIYQFNQYRLKNCVNFDERLIMPYRFPEGPYKLDVLPRYWVMVWNKLIKKEFLDKHNIRFKPGMQFGEDALFSAECILANNGLYHAHEATVYHVLDDKNSLCRGSGLTLERIELLDGELSKLYDKQTLPAKKEWMKEAINVHRHSRLFRRLGFKKWFKGKYDVVYLVKECAENPELTYSLRSLEENWPYHSVWFCGGCPDNLKPDHHMKIDQVGLNKWEKVRNMIVSLCKNDNITEDFWLFNDDFFVLKKAPEDIPPQYNGELMEYIERIERKQGGPDGFSIRLRQTHEALTKNGETTLNYEVHKPMLINRKKLLTVLNKYPYTPGFRSLYGNHWKIGGQSKHDMKVKIVNFNGIDRIKNHWEFLSTSDTSFRDGNVGKLVRTQFNKKSRFEK